MEPCTLPDSVWQGDPSCAYDYNRGQYLNGINLYRRINCEITSEFQTYYSSTCDTTEQDTTWQCIAIFGNIVQLRKGNSNTIVACDADGSCSAAMAKVALGQCGVSSSSSQRPRSSSSESEGSSSDSENPDSSPSGGGSSGSTGGSSGSGGSGPEGGEGGEGSSSSGGIWDDYSSSVGEGGEGDYGGMSDNALLQEIAGNTRRTALNTGDIAEYAMTFLPNISDATWEISGVAHDINTNTRSIIEHQENIDNATGSIDNKLSSTNNLLQQIANKNWNPTVQAPTVNVDVSGVISAQQGTTDSIHNTNSILQGMKTAIEGIGGRLDTMSIKVDTSKAPASIDSSLKFWGDSRNRNLGTAGLDTSGWGAIGQDVVSFGDSVFSNFSGMFAVNGCDTTGGRRCDGSVIGSGGMDSARSSTRRVYSELRDSLMHGQFADSLDAWGSKFTAGGTLTGSGSNNCPSFLSRRHTITIGVSSVDMQLDGILCATLFGSVTPWTLARLLIRSIVAFFCMFYLFKCATGFGGGGDE